MADSIEDVIARLAAEAGPVRRLRPPALRAALWLLVVAAFAGLAVFWFSDLDVFVRRIRDPRLATEVAATLLTGIAAVVAAFHLSLPDRSPAWALLPIGPLALWIGSSGYGCYRHWISVGSGGWELGDSAHCFAFILGAGMPLAVSLLLLLRTAYPLAPLRVAAVGGLGVAAISAFVLQFFHPFDVTFMDLMVHLAAVGIVIGVSSALGGYRRGRPA